jgi:DNA replication protein DnaC
MCDLLTEMAQADLEYTLKAYLKKRAKLGVLVINDFLLTSTTEHKQKYLMEVFELRSRDRSLIISFQMEKCECLKMYTSGVIAETTLNRTILNFLHIYLWRFS